MPAYPFVSWPEDEESRFEELGNAIAGRPFVIPIVETRKEKKAETAHDPNS